MRESAEADVADPIGSVGFHPYMPLLLVTAGARHVKAPLDDSESSIEEDSEQDEAPQAPTSLGLPEMSIYDLGGLRRSATSAS